jgi:hypothetical protein
MDQGQSLVWQRKVGGGVVKMATLLILLAGGCAPQQRVAIPPEWRTASPPAAAGALSPSQETAPAAPAAKPILEPPARIRESDLSPSREKPAATGKSVPSPGAPAAKAGQPVSSPKPQVTAAMHLVTAGKAALEKGKTDAAVEKLEQAIQVDAYNAEAFYQLSRAWQVKGNLKRALEFARKAEILYHDDPKELKKVYLHEVELLKLSGQRGEAEIYRQKAARLSW